MLTFQSHLVCILLSLQDLISQFEILSNELSSLLLLLLHLADQILDHRLLGLQLQAHRLVGFHSFLAFVNDIEVDITDVAHLIDD